MGILVNLGIAVLIFSIGFLIYKAALNLNNNNKKDNEK